MHHDVSRRPGRSKGGRHLSSADTGAESVLVKQVLQLTHSFRNWKKCLRGKGEAKGQLLSVQWVKGWIVLKFPYILQEIPSKQYHVSICLCSICPIQTGSKNAQSL